MAERDAQQRRALAAVRRYDALLMRDHNVHGVGVGEKVVGGERTGEPCVTVLVMRKLPRHLLPEWRIIPAFLDPGGGSVPTDVVEAAPFYTYANTTRIRPALPGTSIGVELGDTGTFGAVVVDNRTGNSLILSNNHVLADYDRAPIGASILQPGPRDGGTEADEIAVLLRRVPLDTNRDNLADAAVAQPLRPDLIRANPLDGVPAPSPDTPAVGLIFGGNDDNATVMNPIQTVLALLEVGFPAGSSVLSAEVGQQLQKTGRSTGRTTGTVTMVGSTVHISTSIGRLRFVDTIVATPMAELGDSGAVAVLLR